MIVGVVILHIWALHTHGSNNPLGIDVKPPQDTIPFHPYYTVKDTFTFGLFFIGQFIDLLRLSTMVSFANLENSASYGGGSHAVNTNTVAPVFNISVNVPAAENSEQKSSLTK